MLPPTGQGMAARLQRVRRDSVCGWALGTWRAFEANLFWKVLSSQKRMSATGTLTLLEAIKLFAFGQYDHIQCVVIMSEQAIDCFCIMSLLVPFRLLCSNLEVISEIDGYRRQGEANETAY